LQRESSPNGTRSFFFVGAWISEISEHAVAQVSGDVAIVTRDDVIAGRPKHIEDLHHVLGIQRIGQRNRTDDIAKQDGYRPPLRAARRDGWRPSRHCRVREGRAASLTEGGFEIRLRCAIRAFSASHWVIPIDEPPFS